MLKVFLRSITADSALERDWKFRLMRFGQVGLALERERAMMLTWNLHNRPAAVVLVLKKNVYSPHTLLIFMFSLAIPQMSCMMFLKVLYHLSLSIVCQCFYQRSTSPLNFSMSVLLISPINGRTRQTVLMQSLAQCSAGILLEAMLTRTGTW